MRKHCVPGPFSSAKGLGVSVCVCVCVWNGPRDKASWYGNALLYVEVHESLCGACNSAIWQHLVAVKV